MSGLFRCAGDILFDDNEPLPGQISNVQLKQYSETSNFLQYKIPLTLEQPYFFAKVRSLAQQSRITIGIAGPDIDNDAHPGHWNNTVGYHNDTGNCFTSHSCIANTKGEKFSVNDVFGVLITHFGKKMSTVMFLKNEIPVATRYLFECDHSKFLPTVCLENGPIDLGIMWPQAALGAPNFEETNMINWIKDTGVQYDMLKNVFHYDKMMQEVTIQSPVPLTKDMVHFEVVVQEAEDSESPAVGIATCSPLKPPPTCNLLRDFFRWKANGVELQSKVGQRIGFGIHYSPDVVNRPSFSDKDEQLVLCFVTLNMQIVFFRMMMQPEGGFFPLIVLTKNASKISVDVETNRDLGNDSTKEILDKLYKEKESPALAVLDDDRGNRVIHETEMFRHSDDIEVEVTDTVCNVGLPRKVKKIHVLQFKKPLTPLETSFSVEIVKLNEDSVISIGVADSTFPLNKHLGKFTPSTGYVSRDGKMYYDEKPNGNMEGERFGVGDTVSLKMLSFSEEDMSVVLFIKNDRPIGTRYLKLNSVQEFFPTLSLCGNGYDVDIRVYWQNRLGEPQSFFPANLNDLCLPEDAEVDLKDQIIYVKDHSKPVCIQWPCPINEDNLNHFEIKILDEFGASIGVTPPVIALASACPQTNPIIHSNYRQDFLRFWAVGEAESAVEVNDLIGWGVLFPPSQKDVRDRMVICYMTINRNIALVRVMFEPTGGLFPCICLPPDSVNRVKIETSALTISSHPLTEEIVDLVLSEAQEIYTAEQAFLKSGRDLDEFEIEKSKLLQTMPDLELKTQSHISDEVNGSAHPKLMGVVTQAKSANLLQKAVRSYREKSEGAVSGRSKACVIL